MNINWDQQLAQYFNTDYLTSWKKIDTQTYQIVLLEGSVVKFECSIQGYSCMCHQNTYQSGEGLLRAHSPKYISVFNKKLYERLNAMSQNLKQSQDYVSQQCQQGRGESPKLKQQCKQ